MTNPVNPFKKENRLNKFLASCGVGSRRACDKMVLEGRVVLNGSVITDLSTVVRDSDTVELDGKKVRPEELIYILLNKPAGVVTTLSDPEGRKHVGDLIGRNIRVKPVGRLDMYSTGVLILTNDGDLHFRLTHPRFKIVRTYEAKIEGKVGPEIREKIRSGVELEKGKIATGRVVEIIYNLGKTVVRIDLMEGMNREIRRIFEVLGYRTLSLDRIRFAGIGYGRLKPGEWRFLKLDEIQRLKEKCQL
ncbi:MAG: pseudouridine synthase [Candidatus Marinimicrobia bacterium CG08_land_8_20_14_0_20_45_22]|nr:MAG: pseudouridine synthase [Candidatus Marinimicrobia bacterium CG08_land_8_20_14_0_20_45_22]